MIKKLSSLLLLLSLIVASCSKTEEEYQAIDPLPIATDDVVLGQSTGSVTTDILLNDITGDIIVPNSVSIVGGTDTDSNGTLDSLIVLDEGTWTVNTTTGFITFMPLSTFVGNPTAITYNVKDAQGNTSNNATLTINLINIATIPYTNLSDYHFFVGDIKNQIPAINVLAYEPASALFTDYAHKKRFIWMPEGVKANYVSDSEILDFPTGTVLIKNFYYETIQPGNTTKIIETRMMVKKSDGWVFHEYVWNDAQTDAILMSDIEFSNGSSQTFTFTKPNNQNATIDYRIPSDSECIACHKINELPTPIGPKPENMNHNFSYGEGNKNILQKLVEQGYLTSYPSNINSVVDYNDTSKSLDLRARSYLDANCAHCHQDLGRCDYRPLRLKFNLTNIDSNIGICVDADETIGDPPLTKLISPGNFNKSILHYRMNTNDESERMPLLGRTIIHDEGIALIEQWISSMTQSCN